MIVKLFVNSKLTRIFNNTSELYNSLKLYPNDRLTVTIFDKFTFSYYYVQNETLYVKNDIGWQE